MLGLVGRCYFWGSFFGSFALSLFLGELRRAIAFGIVSVLVFRVAVGRSVYSVRCFSFRSFIFFNA